KALKEETKKQFEPFVIGLSDGSQCEMSSILRLDADNRKAVRDSYDALTELDKEDESPENIERVIEIVSKIFYAVAGKQAKLLADLQDRDKQFQVALMYKVLNAWWGDTEAGEA